MLAAVGPIPAPGTPELAQQHFHTCCSLVSWQPAFDAILEKKALRSSQALHLAQATPFPKETLKGLRKNKAKRACN